MKIQMYYKNLKKKLTLSVTWMPKYYLNKHLSVQDLENHNAKSYFDLNNCTIYVSQSATAETIAHELFHEIDKTYGIIDNGALEEQIRNDYKRLMKLLRSMETLSRICYTLNIQKHLRWGDVA